jgi:hypothetical protein
LTWWQGVTVNTRFEYVYRDGSNWSNYRQFGDVVFDGDYAHLGPRLSKALERGEFFISHQIRLPK